MIQIYSEVLQTFRLAAQGKTAGPAAARRICASASRPTSIRCRSSTRRSKTQATDSRALSARRDHAAADGDVPLVGFAERVAAPDPQPQLPVRQSASPRGARASPTAAGCWVEIAVGRGALHARATAKRSSRAPCGPGTRSARRAGAWQLAPDANEAREGLPAQPPDHRRAAAAPTATAFQQLGSRSPARPAGTTCACASRKADADEPKETSPQFAARCRRRRDRRAGMPATARGRQSFARTTADHGSRRDDPARARHRSQRLRRLPRLRDELQGVEHVGLGRAARRRQSVRRGSDRHVLQPRADLRGRRVSRTRRRCTSRSRACTARTRRACPCARPARATSAPRTASCWSTTTSASAASIAPGRARTACASSTKQRQVMTKCTLCVDRINDAALPEAERKPACVHGVSDQRAPVRRHPGSGIRGVDARSASAAAMR